MNPTWNFADFITLYKTATIVLLQTTYMHLVVEGKQYKVTFKDKAEFQLKRSASGEPTHYATHPLLLFHNEPRTTLYINSKPKHPQLLIEALEGKIISVFQGWQDWRKVLYGNNKAAAVTIVQQNILQGSGILLDYAPSSIVKAVVAVCEQHGVATRYFGSLEEKSSPRGQFSVLFIGTCYVVARDFQVAEL